MSTPARTKRGTFQKGTSGNPSGRPKSESAELRRALAAPGEDGRDYLERVPTDSLPGYCSQL